MQRDQKCEKKVKIRPEIFEANQFFNKLNLSKTLQRNLAQGPGKIGKVGL